MMQISEIRIQNFKSFKDTSVKLSDLNLMIGANNSGKTNFFQALLFLHDIFSSSRSTTFSKLKENSHNKKGVSSKNPMAFTVKGRIKASSVENYVFRIEFYDDSEGDSAIFYGESFEKELAPDFNLPDLNYIDSHFRSYTLHSIGMYYTGLVEPNFDSQPLADLFNAQLTHGRILLHKNKGYRSNSFQISNDPREFLRFTMNEGETMLDLIQGLKLYRPDPNRIIHPYPLNGDESVNEDASNLVSFFDKMQGVDREVMESINEDLRTCISEFRDIRIDTIKAGTNQFDALKKQYQRDTFKKFGVSDKNKNTYWAEELSEGTIYFIALLAIIHQPNPPSVMLIEEIEKGIHPRRIQEIITFIQKLADEKDIQVIISTHSPVVVDQFSHDASKILVFDKIDGITKVSNLKEDIIDPKNSELKSINVEEIDFESSLGDNWVMGLLNGIPND